MPSTTNLRRHRSYDRVQRKRKLLSCVRCHEMKKKCDRKIPCNTCAKLNCNEACFYQKTITRTILLNGENILQLSREDTVETLPYKLIQANGDTILDIWTRYFQTVHPWLPIISMRRFLQRLMSQQPPQADFSLLLLSMYLLIEIPKDLEKSTSTTESAYKTTKLRYNEVQLLLPASMEIVQTGLLITFYEHAHGHHSDAYLSIGTCVRMARTLGLNNTSTPPNEAEALVKYKEGKIIWWGCIILDKIINLQGAQPAKPLFSELHKRTDELPPDPDDWDTVEECTIRYPAGVRPSMFVGAFSNQARAVMLLGEVLEHNAQDYSDLDVREAEVRRLDKSLQSFLSMILADEERNHRIYCGANSITSGALFSLHRAQLAYNRKSGVSDVCESSQYSILALNAISRILLALAQTVNSVSTVDGSSLLSLEPPCPIFPTLQAALWLVECPGKRLNDIEELREYLWRLSQRWSAAVDALKEIDKATPIKFRQLDKYLHPKRKKFDPFRVQRCIC